MGTGGSFPGGEGPGWEADRSPPYSAGVKNAWIYIFTPLYIFMAWCLIKPRLRIHSVVLSEAQKQIYLYLVPKTCFSLSPHLAVYTTKRLKGVRKMGQWYVTPNV